VQQVRDALAGLAEVDPCEQSDESIRSALPVLVTAFHQLSAVLCSVLGAFDTRDLAELDACRTARTWLVSFGRMTPNAASVWVKRARLLGDLPALRAAALSGTVSMDHVRKVLDLVERVGLPAVVGFDDLLRRRQSESRAAVLGLGREERAEDPLAFGLIDAGPVVVVFGSLVLRFASVSALITKYLSVSKAFPGPAHVVWLSRVPHALGPQHEIPAVPHPRHGSCRIPDAHRVPWTLPPRCRFGLVHGRH
jgi:hypothetical protein